MPASALPEIIEYVKPGGYFVTSLRESYYDPAEPMGYHNGLNDLVKSNKMKLVKTYNFMRGITDEAIIAANPLFAPMTSMLFVY